MSEKEYSCVEPFWIDDGELDGIRPAEVFVLGVEWQKVYGLMHHTDYIACPIHVANGGRIKRLLVRNGWRFTIKPSVEGWLEMSANGPVVSKDTPDDH